MTDPALVIFDCDGVLVDSERLSHEVLRQMLTEHGVVMSLEQALERFMGTSDERFLELVDEITAHAAPADFAVRFRQRCFEAFRRELAPVAGARELLASLPHAFCVASNGTREKMRFTLGHSGLANLVPQGERRLFSAQDVKRPKPAPDLFLHAAATCGVKPERCVVIEDSPSGVAAARAARMRVLGFAAMGQARRLLEAGADAVFERLADVPAALAGVRRG